MFGNKDPKEGADRDNRGRDKRKSVHRLWAWHGDWYEKWEMGTDPENKKKNWGWDEGRNYSLGGYRSSRQVSF